MRTSRLDALLTRWAFRTMLLKRAHTREAIALLCAGSPFRKGELVDDGIGFELRLRKPSA